MSFGNTYTAADAFTEACVALADKQKVFEENVFKRIKQAADEGMFSLEFNKASISGSFAEHLRSLGYEVDLTSSSFAKLFWGRRVRAV
jgi:hypothetical protein